MKAHNRNDRSLATGYVPAVLVMRHVENWIKRQDIENCVLEANSCDYTGLKIVGARWRLGFELGIAPDTILKWGNGKTKWLSFNDADRLLCATGNVLRWHTDKRLKKVYKLVNLGPPPDKRIKRSYRYRQFTPVIVGQLWESRDKRDKGLVVPVLSVDEQHVEIQRPRRKSLLRLDQFHQLYALAVS